MLQNLCTKNPTEGAKDAFPSACRQTGLLASKQPLGGTKYPFQPKFRSYTLVRRMITAEISRRPLDKASRASSGAPPCNGRVKKSFALHILSNTGFLDRPRGTDLTTDVASVTEHGINPCLPSARLLVSHLCLYNSRTP